MNKSRIYLGITTALLTVAGLGAKQINGPLKAAFYVTMNSAYCKSTFAPCTTGGTVQCYYTVILGSIAIRYALWTKGPQGPKTSANCIVPLCYDIEH